MAGSSSPPRSSSTTSPASRRPSPNCVRRSPLTTSATRSSPSSRPAPITGRCSAYAAAGFEARIVHPSISRYFRQAGSYDIKTDPTDLEGIFRAAINGFGLQQPPADPLYTALQMWARHRRDLVQKTTLVGCQILEHLEAFLPGYARCFDDVFITKIALLVPVRYPNPAAVAQAGLDGLTELARLAKVRFQTRTLLRILGWAQNASAPGDDAALHQRLFAILNDDRITKEKQIQASERELVNRLVQTPYVRLLALPGINVVLAGEFAGEAGPMVNYAKARTITGRAGLYPGAIRVTRSITPVAWPAAATAASARRCSWPPTP